jgi:hypothetical protein
MVVEKMTGGIKMNVRALRARVGENGRRER